MQGYERRPLHGFLFTPIMRNQEGAIRVKLPRDYVSRGHRDTGVQRGIHYISFTGVCCMKKFLTFAVCHKCDTRHPYYEL